MSEDSYTLNELVAYGKKNFRTEYAAVANTALYNMQSRDIEDTDGDTDTTDVLLVGFFNNKSSNKQLWAVYVKDKAGQGGIILYQGKVGERLKEVPERQKGNIRLDEPFLSIHGKHQTKEKREAGLERLGVFVEFVSMLMGKVDVLKVCLSIFAKIGLRACSCRGRTKRSRMTRADGDRRYRPRTHWSCSRRPANSLLAESRI